MMYGSEGYAKYVPVQLFESIFLLALFAFLFVRAYKGKNYGFSLYLILYGVWRFALEYIRGDYRGDTVVSFLTPSQLTAVLLVLIGIALVYVEKFVLKKTNFEVRE